MRTWPLAILLPLVGLAAVSACSTSPSVTVRRVDPGSGHERIEGDPVRLRRAPREVYDGIRSGFYAVRSEEDWREAWPGGKASRMPRTIDLTSRMMLVAVARHKDIVKTSIEAAVENSSGIHVLVRETKNGEGCVLPKTSGLAYDAVIAPRIEKPVKFYVEQDRASSCGEAPEVSVTCRVNDARAWAERVAAQPGDSVECNLTSTARGAFAITDRVLSVAEVPSGSSAKLAYEKGPTRGSFTVDVFGTYTLRGEAVDDSGRKSEAVAKVEALPPKSKDVLVQLVWTGFDATDDPETFPRLRLRATDPTTPPKGSKTPPRECWAEQPLADFCVVKVRGTSSFMTLKAGDAKVPLSVLYVDERAEGGPLACVHVYFDGARTVDTCDRSARAADAAWEVGVLDMTTGKLVDPNAPATDAGADGGAAAPAADAGTAPSDR